LSKQNSTLSAILQLQHVKLNATNTGPTPWLHQQHAHFEPHALLPASQFANTLSTCSIQRSHILDNQLLQLQVGDDLGERFEKYR
jgi:hypothetical protein